MRCEFCGTDLDVEKEIFSKDKLFTDHSCKGGKKMEGIKCGSCGQLLKSGNDYHTYESCLLFKLNECRKFLGKQPIELDIEAEDNRQKEEALTYTDKERS